MTILFYRPRDPYGGFANFSRHRVRIYGLTWQTSEHAFQAMKFAPHAPDALALVRDAATPKEAAEVGRNTSLPLHPGWDKAPSTLSSRLPDALDPLLQPNDGLRHEEPLFNRYKDLIMYEVVYAKVMQNLDVRKMLLDTKDEALVEDTTGDVYWGWGSSHLGENKLGRILMAVRNALVRGMQTQTAFGRPDRADFVCTAEYPWRTEYGPGVHPDARIAGEVPVPGFECFYCNHYFEKQTA